jgi:thymidylate synthase (FAD)
VSMNCRELLYFFQLSCCNRAQWEIRGAANRMLEICRMHLPAVFSTSGAKCTALGYCPEDKKFSCSRFSFERENKQTKINKTF